jgi:RHS repeat-associated protein
MMMPGRYFSPESGYRYGFNGKENDSEVKGVGNQQDYGLRIYDTRIGKFLSVDPLTNDYPWYTPYQFAGNKPIWAVDLDGGEEKPYHHPESYDPVSTPVGFTTENGNSASKYKILDGTKSYWVCKVNTTETYQDYYGNQVNRSYYFVYDPNLVNDKNLEYGKGEIFVMNGTHWHMWQTNDQLGTAGQVVNSAADGIAIGTMATATVITAAVAAPTAISLLPEATLTERATSAGLDYGSQVVGNLISGKNWKTSLTDVNVTSVFFSGINPGSGWGRLAFNNSVASAFSVSTYEGYNGIWGGKSYSNAGLQAIVGTLAGRATRGTDARGNMLSTRLNHVNTLLGRSSLLSESLQKSILYNKFVSAGLTLGSGGAGNGLSNTLETK